ncbi:hypothetical protein QUB63_16140 [Microcoleus sp. ARI1-B5]|uniref:hypothetical protein n=1 Tax=unclassified Microcoleus TaxID=2642155 RepID=UPI002FD3CF47
MKKSRPFLDRAGCRSYFCIRLYSEFRENYRCQVSRSSVSVVQIAAAVAVMGYFWFQNGQQAVSQLSSQSIDTEGDRIYPEYEVLAKAFAVPDKLR